MSKTMKVYRDKSGDWRWQLWSSSDLVAESGEGYESRGYAVKKAMEFKPDDAEIEVEECESVDPRRVHRTYWRSPGDSE